MYSFRKAFLLINILLVTACASYKVEGTRVKNTNDFIKTGIFNDADSVALFRAKIKVYGNTSSGILAVKKGGAQHKRVALLSNMGNTLFDFEYRAGKTKVNYVVEDLNKKLIINNLTKYFKILIQQKFSVLKTYKTGDSLTILSAFQHKKVVLSVNQENDLSLLRQYKGKRKQVSIRYYQSNQQLDSIHFTAHSLPVAMWFYREE